MGTQRPFGIAETPFQKRAREAREARATADLERAMGKSLDEIKALGWSVRSDGSIQKSFSLNPIAKLPLLVWLTFFLGEKGERGGIVQNQLEDPFSIVIPIKPHGPLTIGDIETAKLIDQKVGLSGGVVSAALKVITSAFNNIDGKKK